MKYHPFSCNVLWKTGSYFLNVIIFNASSFFFHFIVFTQLLMNEFAHILIHISKIFNSRVSLKMLFPIFLAIIEKELWIQLLTSNFQNSTFEKNTITVAEVALIQVSILNIGLNKTKRKINGKTHGMPWHLQNIENLCVLGFSLFCRLCHEV